MTQTKPILYNGFKLKKNLTIVNRIERFFFTDIYELSDGTYFYLFLKLNLIDVIDRSDKYEILKVESENKFYLGIISKSRIEHSELPAIQEKLVSKRGFECVAGMDELKQLLIRDVINPLRNPEKFKKFKVSIPNGIILYGPPGCGKTFIVQKLAEELGYNFFEVKHSDLATPYIHGSVGNIGKTFDMAKQNSPAIVFFDEISGLVPDRKKLNDSSHKEEEINEFLMQLNNAADEGILVVGATNYIERIDPAVLRPGRFDKKIYVSKPDTIARKELFKIGLSNRPHDENIDYSHLAKMTEGFSCADIIKNVIDSAARTAANLDKHSIDQELLEEEISRIKNQLENESNGT